MVAVTFPLLVCWDCTITVLYEPLTTTFRLLPIAVDEPPTPPAPLKLSAAPLSRALAPAKMLLEPAWNSQSGFPSKTPPPARSRRLSPWTALRSR